MKQPTGSKLASSVRNAKAKQTQDVQAQEQIAPVTEQPLAQEQITPATPTPRPDATEPVARLMPSRRVWPD